MSTCSTNLAPQDLPHGAPGRRRRGGVAKKTSAALAAMLSVGLLAACGHGDDSSSALTPTDSLAVTTSETPSASTDNVEPVRKEVTGKKIKDPGLNVNFIYQGAQSGQQGGTVITVAVENLNDEPLPPESIADAVLRYNDGSGSGDMTEADKLKDDKSGITSGLDLPLGAKATSNVKYAFDVAPGNLWDGEFQVGNVIIEGNLNQ